MHTRATDEARYLTFEMDVQAGALLPAGQAVADGAVAHQGQPLRESTPTSLRGLLYFLPFATFNRRVVLSAVL